MKRFFVLLAVIAIELVANPAFAVTYSITDLGTSFLPNDINNSGQIAGQYTGKAVIWGNGNTQELSYGGAHGINNAGQVVGYTQQGISTLWQNGVASGLNYLPNTYGSTLNSINDLGQIVGSVDRQLYWQGGVYRHATLWENSYAYDLGTLSGGNYSIATGINNLGEIIGYSTTRSVTNYEGPEHAFIWKNGVMTDLFAGNANAINNNSQIVGGITTQSGSTQAVLSENGTLTYLGTLGGNNSNSTDINNLGQVVGYSGRTEWLQHTFIWENGLMTDLNNYIVGTGWELWAEAYINDLGQITGRGFFNGETHAYLLTPVAAPVPEPSTLAMLGFGIVAFVIRRKKKLTIQNKYL